MCLTAKKGASYIEKDAPNPINVYGTTKLEGEQQVAAVESTYLIFRTSWVYSLRRAGFIGKVLNWARTQEVMRIVDDQMGQPHLGQDVGAGERAGHHPGRSKYFGLPASAPWLISFGWRGHHPCYEWARAVIEFDPHKEGPGSEENPTSQER